MKININKIKVVPKIISSSFKLCVYGAPTSDVQKWAKLRSCLQSALHCAKKHGANGR